MASPCCKSNSRRWPKQVALIAARIENLAIKGGLSRNGKPAELVAMQDGKPISMRTGLPYSDELTSPVKRTISFDEKVDEGVQRSMARRKKNEPPMNINQKCNHCDKVFKRPCDLTYVAPETQLSSRRY